MDPLNIVLWLIGILLVALIPCGVVLTRNSGGKKAGTTPH
jgi:hypothetical protein